MKICPQCRNTYPDDYQACPRDFQLLVHALAEIGPGSVVRGKYEVLGKLGAGGMATVYKVKHLAFHETLALKLVHSESTDKDFIKRFRNEGVVARQLKHPNAVRIDDLDFAEDGRPFIVMEYVEGPTVDEARRKRPGPWGVSESLAIAAQVARALGAAHTLGIVHRDIKPHNVLLTTGPDGHGLVKVTDFGIAKTSSAFQGMTSIVTEASTLVGTPEYMSPEQVSGGLENAVDGRADLYSLGLMLYEMVTGNHPFRAETPMRVLYQQVHTLPLPPITFNSEVSPAVSELILKSLEKRPEDRFQSAEEMLQALEGPEQWWREYQGVSVTPAIPEQPAYSLAARPPLDETPSVEAQPRSPPSPAVPFVAPPTSASADRPKIGPPGTVPTRVTTWGWVAGGMGILALIVVIILVSRSPTAPVEEAKNPPAVATPLAGAGATPPAAQLESAPGPVIAPGPPKDVLQQKLAPAATPTKGTTAAVATVPPKPVADRPPPDAKPAEDLSATEAEAKKLYDAKDYSKAIPLLQRACDGGVSIGCLYLGTSYYFGYGVGKNPSRAAVFYRKACDGGEPLSCRNLGVQYHNGDGVAKDAAGAVSLYRKACDGGDPMGCTGLGYLYATGDGVAKDAAQAVSFYRKGCDGGEAYGCRDLATHFESADGVTQDVAQALIYYRKACSGHDQPACEAVTRLTPSEKP